MPLIACLLAAAFIAVPPVVWRLSAEVGAAIGASLADAHAARVVVASLVLPAFAAGAAITVSMPPVEAFGAQVRAAPVRARELAVAAALPLLAGSSLVAPLLLALVVPALSAAPGGVPAAVTVVGAVVAAAALGAAAAELASAAWHGHRTSRVALAAILPALGIAWWRGGDPLDPVVSVMTGASSAPICLVALGGVATCAGSSWLTLRAVRPGAERRRRSPLAALAGARVPRSLAAPTMILLRRSDVRLALVAAASLGVCCLLAGALLDLGTELATMLGATSALAAAVIAPLASGGALVCARWLLATSPTTRWSIAARWAAAGEVLLLLAVAPVVAAGLVWGADGAVLRPLAAAAVAGGGAGLLAGSVVPWRPTALGDQLLSLAALASISGATLVLVGAAAEHAPSGWSPPAIAAPIIALHAAALVSLRRRIGSS
jgi:hypothetical protein